MTEQDDTSEQQPDAGEVPTDDELDVEGPNESAPGHNPDDDDSASA